MANHVHIRNDHNNKKEETNNLRCQQEAAENASAPLLEWSPKAFEDSTTRKPACPEFTTNCVKAQLALHFQVVLEIGTNSSK
jgi:hypothetical protein